MTNDESLEILEGCLLGDAGLVRSKGIGNAYFWIDLSGEEHTDILFSIKKALCTLGISVSDSCPKITPRTAKNGRQFQEASLWSHVNPLLTRLYAKWYSEKHKVLPAELKLTPLLIAYWFMGDGSSFHLSGSVSLVRAKFCANDFSKDEALRLKSMLIGLGVRVTLPDSENVLFANDALSVAKLMNMVKPYMLPSYSYKLKWPVLRRLTAAMKERISEGA